MATIETQSTQPYDMGDTQVLETPMAEPATPPAKPAAFPTETPPDKTLESQAKPRPPHLQKAIQEFAKVMDRDQALFRRLTLGPPPRVELTIGQPMGRTFPQEALQLKRSTGR